MSLIPPGGLPGKALGGALVLLAVCLLWACPPAEAQNRRGRPDGVHAGRPGEISPDKLERWQRMTPEERERIRERYHRWKELPPEQRDRILERKRRWRELPESERTFLRERREIYRNAWPEEQKVIKKFFRRWRELPPDRRQSMRRKFAQWRGMPASEREEQMMNWSFYRKLSPGEQQVIQRFLFSEPRPRPPRGPRGGSPEDSPLPGPGIPGGKSGPPR